MIKLKTLLKEIKSTYIIVGCVDDDFNIIMDNNIESHLDLLAKYGWPYNRDKYNFRYNANNQTIYWYQEPSDDVKEEVKSLIRKKFPNYYITKNKSIHSNDKLNYQKLQMKAHGLSEITDVEREEMYPEDSDKWDDWVEYLDHFDYDCPRIELSKLKTRFDLEYIAYFEQKIIKLYDNKKRSVWLEYDKENETFDVIKDIMEWIYSNDAEHIVNISADDIYNGHLETTLKEFKENPSPVYHYTTEENWELIKQDGELVGSSGTGINNRNSHGIFTSIDPEEYQIGTYGNICLELNLPAFKSELKISDLNLEYEPQVAEHLVREYIASTLEIGEIPDDYHSEGISPYTIIVGYKMPLKFIKQI